eukprot:TRINITY_DN16663_c0_g1_i1.p1 TRINITY_DN16663_c0_g1~~TRINITY_DN16663_c0_g1_i1.p1  ORF type:complete len:359 (+),score=52.32 TRINITY_DN16663_c0_g1_i1:73-1149(+)
MAARAILLCLALVAVAAHYGQPPCAQDEAQGEVQGAPGSLCAPRCDVSTYNCPMDTPYGSSAQAQCMLKDVDQVMFCALLCQVDSQCPSGSRCRQLKQVEVGVCLFPVSFTDWARSSVSRKFAVGWPSGAGTAPLQIQKTFGSLQNLKSKYSIDEYDPDMVTLKEFLASMSGTGGVPAAASLSAMSSVATLSAISGSPPSPPPQSAALVPSPFSSGQSGNSGGDFSAGNFMKDINYFQNNVVAGGIPGIQREIKDTVWNLEHLNKRGVCSELLRSILLMGFAYLAIGCLIKSQMYNSRGMEMIPNIGFWQEYPNLCADGVTYVQILAGGLLGSPKGTDDLSGGIGRGPRGGVGSFDAL